jgi:hypothetical protein
LILHKSEHDFLFEVEKGESNGLLYIAEQLPGMVDSLDVSGILIRYGEQLAAVLPVHLKDNQ